VKPYVMTTGTIFGLITIAHVLRMFSEGSELIREPLFILLTLIAGALTVWAGRLVWSSSGTEAER
jgi:hypothetical protein